MAQNDWYTTTPDRQPFFTVHWAGGCRLSISYASVNELFINPRGKLTINTGGKRIEGRFLEYAKQRNREVTQAAMAAFEDDWPPELATPATEDSTDESEVASVQSSTQSKEDSLDYDEAPTDPIAPTLSSATVPAVRDPADPPATEDMARHQPPVDPAAETAQSLGAAGSSEPIGTLPVIHSDQEQTQTLASFEDAFASALIKGLHHVPGVINIRVLQRDKLGNWADYPTG